MMNGFSLGSTAEPLKQLSYNTVWKGAYVPTGNTGINTQGLRDELTGSSSAGSVRGFLSPSILSPLIPFYAAAFKYFGASQWSLHVAFIDLSLRSIHGK